MTTYLSSNGTSYELYGNASQTALVFIHGLGLNKNLWRHQIDQLQEEYFILNYDLFGHGMSKKADDDPSLSVFTEQLYAILVELNFSKVILIGFSLGGMIARHFTKTYQSMVKGLIILNSPHKRSPSAQESVYKRYLQVAEKGPISTVDDAIVRWFTPEFDQNNKEITDCVRSWVLANEHDIYSKNYWVLVDGVKEIIDLHGVINCPTLVITSDQDYGNGPEMAQEIANEILGSKLIIIKGLRHMALFEHPQKINQHLLNFLNMQPKEQ